MGQITLEKLKKPLLLFLIVFTLFVSNTYADWAKDMKNGTYRRLMTSGDQIPNSFLPWLITYKNTVSFDPIIKTIRQLEGGKERPYFLIRTSKGFRTAYPIIPAFMAVPFYYLPVALQKVPELTYHQNILKIFLLGRITASFYTAFSVVLFYYILKEVSKNEKWILLFTFFYAFGTNTWSVSSRGMWQHTFAQFFLSIIVLLLLRALKKPKLIPWLGFVTGIAVLARPTNILIALAISFYVLAKHKDQLAKYILAVLPSILFLVIYNYLTFGSVFVEGYGARNDYNWSTPLSVSLPAYMFSPARSFLFISPPLLLAFYGLYKVFDTKKYSEKLNLVLRYLGIGFILSLLMFAKWYTWDGSNAFGYRMLSDFLPIIGLLAFVVVDKMKQKHRLVILALIIYSVFVHANAVIHRKSRCSRDHTWSFYCLLPPAEKSKY